MIHKLLGVLPSETAHKAALGMLGLVDLRRDIRNNSTKAGGMLDIPNRIGLAAGFDKHGDAINGLTGLGFGFVELGTVTPLPQSPIPGSHITRIGDGHSLINKLGFPSKGVQHMRDQIAEHRNKKGWGHKIGVSIAPNRTTVQRDHKIDICYMVHALSNFVDFFVLNFSSPNSDFREYFHNFELFKGLLEHIRSQEKARPLWIKVPLDLAPHQVRGLAHEVTRMPIQAVVLGNTLSGMHNGVVGGISGAHLEVLARQKLGMFVEENRGRTDVVSCGGILSVQDATERLGMGATLVQIYTGLVYRGHNFPRRLALGT